MELLLFVCMRFQVLFHSPPGVLFAFPSQYWFTIGRSRVFSLGGWSPHLQTGCHVSRPTFRFLSTTSSTSCKGLSPSMAALPRAFHCLQSYQKQAAAISLAATFAISVDFFSWSYLDVSVRFVRLMHLWIQCMITTLLSRGSPIRKSADQSPFAGSPQLIASCYVLHRL